MKAWVALENAFSLHSISVTPWIRRNLLPKNLTEHPTIGPTLECFAEAAHKLKLSRVPGPLSPILMNPQFPPGMEPHPLSNIQPDIGIRIHHILQEGKLITLDHINTLCATPNLSFLEYWQIKHYVNCVQNRSLRSINLIRKPMPEPQATTPCHL